jgi:hypothetical protein
MYSLPAILGNPAENAFFRVKAVGSSGLASLPSSIVGEFDFAISASLPYRFSSVALPLYDPSLSTADDLLTAVSQASSIAKWSGSEQGYTQYLPSIPATNFDIETGYPYFIYANQASVLTLLGEAVFSSYYMEKFSTTSFHTVMVPLDRPYLTNAAQLMGDIQGCDGVAVWNSEDQGYEQYIPEIPITNFSVRAGYPYFVSVSQTVQWPETGQQGATRPPKKTIISQGSGRRKAPHAVWGRIRYPNDFTGQPAFTAYLESSPDDRLTETSTGSLLENGYWLVQCAQFASGWEPGESIVIEFKGGDFSYELIHRLSDTPAEHAGEVDLHNTDSQTFILHPNYPNPFNGSTALSFDIGVASHVRIAVLNTLGQHVFTLVDEYREAGSYRAEWSGLNQAGEPVESGVYLLAMQAGKYHKCIKLILSR